MEGFRHKGASLESEDKFTEEVERNKGRECKGNPFVALTLKREMLSQEKNEEARTCCLFYLGNASMETPK